MFKKIKDSYNFSIPFLSCMIFTKFAVDIFYDIFQLIVLVIVFFLNDQCYLLYLFLWVFIFIKIWKTTLNRISK